MKKLSYLITVLLLVLITFVILSQKPQKAKVVLDNRDFYLVVSNSFAARQKGLANLKSLPHNEGMLFIFDNKEVQHFWMKDTYIPLQIIFIDGCEIIEIKEMAVETDPANPQKSYRSSSPADKAIELNSGSVDKDVIGTKINELCP